MTRLTLILAMLLMVGNADSDDGAMSRRTLSSLQFDLDRSGYRHKCLTGSKTRSLPL